MKFVVFYITVVDTDEDGVVIDGPYLGGVMQTKPLAEELARCLTNDRTLPGAVMTKLLSFGPNGIQGALKLARKQFFRLSDEMQDMEVIQKRKRYKRK